MIAPTAAALCAVVCAASLLALRRHGHVTLVLSALAYALLTVRIALGARTAPAYEAWLDLLLGILGVALVLALDRGLRAHARLLKGASGKQRTQLELERSRAFLLTALGQSPVGIVIADAPDERIRLINAPTLTNDARPADEDLHVDQLYEGWECFRTDGTHVMPEEMPLVLALREGSITRNLEVMLRREDGLKRWMLMNAAPVRDENGEIVGGALVLLDVTDRKRDERDMERLLHNLGAKTEELEAVFRATSHDLRAPLVNIEGFGGELERACAQLRETLADAPLESAVRTAVDELLGKEIPLSLDYIRSGTDRLDRLMRGLRRLSRIDKTTPPIEEVDVEELVGEVAQGLQFQLREHAAELTIERLPTCQASRPELCQVFANLIDNAVKFLDPSRPGRVRVSGRRRGRRSVYRVEDNGIGIEPERSERIFGAFHRLDPRGPVPGDGLGLTIVRSLVTRLGGTVRWIDSPGPGCTFEVDLPSQLAASGEPGSSTTPQPTAQGPTKDSRLANARRES